MSNKNSISIIQSLVLLNCNIYASGDNMQQYSIINNIIIPNTNNNYQCTKGKIEEYLKHLSDTLKNNNTDSEIQYVIHIGRMLQQILKISEEFLVSGLLSYNCTPY